VKNNNTSYWVSTPKFTGLIQVDRDGIIVQTAPIFKRWLHQHVYLFDQYLTSTFDETKVIVKEVK